MGTPEFSVPSLEAVHEKFGVKAVVTVPDKPRGRGKKLLPSAVKTKALELNIPVFQPEKLKDEEFLKEMKSLEPDIFIVLAFRILPKELFTIPKIASFNIHASLLPKYRGAAPINRAIINGEEYTGLTSFILQEKVDTGSILLQNSLDIPEGATAGDLHDLMMPEAAKLALNTAELLLSGNFQRFQQDNSKATPAPKIFPDDCRIKWNMHARDLRNFIHGVSPVPGAWTMWDGLRLKIFRANYCSCGSGAPGSWKIENGRFLIHTSKGYIEPVEIQLQGKRAMKIKDFLQGYRGETEGIFE